MADSRGRIRAASSALAWTAVLVCAFYSLVALMAAAAVLDRLGPGDQGPGRAAPPLFVRHAISGGVALLAGSLQLRLATRLLGPAGSAAM